MKRNAQPRTKGAAAVAVALLLGSLAAPARAAGSTPFSNPETIEVPGVVFGVAAGAATPYPSTITVSGLSGVIADVNVRFDGFTHRYVDDVDVLLVGPTGTDTVIMSDAGGSGGVSDIDVILDDEAQVPLPDIGGFGAGTYRPADYETGDSFPAPAPGPSGAVELSTFDGTGPNGTWSLYVFDDAFTEDNGDIGNGWSLDITTAPAPAASDCSSPTKTGTAGDDNLVGTAGNDVIDGGGGNDRINGRGGNDTLCGGTGSDLLNGGVGNDVLIGGAENDVCAGGAGTDVATECERSPSVP